MRVTKHSRNQSRQGEICQRRGLNLRPARRVSQSLTSRPKRSSSPSSSELGEALPSVRSPHHTTTFLSNAEAYESISQREAYVSVTRKKYLLEMVPNSSGTFPGPVSQRDVHLLRCMAGEGVESFVTCVVKGTGERER